MTYLYDDKKKISLSWLRAVASALSREHKVRIEEGDRWAADVKNKVITYTADIQYLDQDTALGLLLHEIGHIRYTPLPDEFVATQALLKKFPTATKASLNMLEDVRIDEIMSDAYDNSRTIMANLHVRAVTAILPMISEYSTLRKYAENNLSPRDQAKVNTREYERDQIKDEVKDAPLYEVYGLALCHYYLEDMTEDVLKDYHDKQIANAAREVSKVMVKKDLAYMDDPQQVSDMFMKDIYPIVKRWFTEEQENKMKEAQQAARASLEQLEDESSGGDDDDGEGYLREQDPDNVANGREKKEPGTECEFKESDNHRVKAPFAKMQTDSLKHKAKQVQVIMNGERPASSGDRSDLPRTYEDALRDVKGLVAGGKARFNRILKDNAIERFVGRFNSGKLNEKRLYKQRSGDYKLFQRKHEIKDKDYAVAVLIDTSGSMDGDRFDRAMDGVVVFSEIFRRIGVDFEIVPFSDEHTVAKRFGAPLSTRTLNEEFMKVYNGGTNALTPYKEVMERIIKHKAQKKMVIMLTDGQFFDSESKEIREMVRRNKGIIQYGIGIGVDLGHVFEDNWIKVTKSSEIVPNFMRILSKHIRKNI